VNRVPALDGLRGVAILLVLSYHCYTHPSGGFYGVDLFFVLSGFLITSLLLAEYDRTGRVNLRAFYVRRARRLLPALLAFLIVISVALFATNQLRELEGDLAAALFYATNIVRAVGTSKSLPLIGHLWSLAQEEQFYFVWPAALLLMLRRWPTKLATFLVAMLIALVLYRLGLLAAGAAHERIYFAPDTHADPLVIGCLLAAVTRTRRVTVPGWFAAAAAIGVAALASTQTAYSIWNLGMGTTAASLLSAVLVAAALNERSVTGRILAFRPLIWLGLISYSLYIWQQLIFKMTGENGDLTLPISIVAATASYWIVEKPFRRRKPKDNRKLASTESPVGGAGAAEVPVRLPTPFEPVPMSASALSVPQIGQ
jgi:peptidoglycan/LPS O-acetylase OafA/YrhL